MTMPPIYEEDKNKKPFTEFWQDPPRRGIHIRITQTVLSAIGLKIATILGNRKKRKRYK